MGPEPTSHAPAPEAADFKPACTGSKEATTPLTPKLMYNYRGVYHRDLTHEVAYYAGKYTGEYYRMRSGVTTPLCLVANDHRFSSNSIKHYVCQGLIEAGCQVVDNGCLPTSVAS